jgi:hypothetical protein
MTLFHDFIYAFTNIVFGLVTQRVTANQFVLATNPLRLTTSNIIFQMNTCGYSPFVTSSLTRVWVCRLQLLMGLASAVILGSYCLRFETPPTWRNRPPYLYPPGTGCPRYVPRHWVPFSSPPTTRRAAVEVFEHASTREGLVTKIRVQSVYL